MQSDFFNVTSYGMAFAPFINAAAFLVCLAAAVYRANIEKLDPMVMYWAGVLGACGAVIGGHVAYGALTTPGDAFHLWNPFDLLDGGKSVLGAFGGAALFGSVYLHVRRRNVLSYGAAALPAVALGYSLARIGCFFNGDDFGTLSQLPWAVQFPAGTQAFGVHWQMGLLEAGASVSLPVHPVQLYHSALGIGLYLLLRRTTALSAIRIAWALTGYGLGRFWLQFFRNDHNLWFAALDVTQWLCLGLFSAGLAVWYCAQQGRAQRQRVFPIGSNIEGF